MAGQFARNRIIFGQEACDKLSSFRVCIFGIGGVGGYVAESLARAGIGHFELVDSDKVAESNINRQIIATYATVGKSKVEVMKERILSINPECDVRIRECFYLPENESEFDFSSYDYVIDCVDTISAKLSIICKAKECNTPVISAMGAGNKMNPAMLEVADIFDTNVDPLAKVMRHELRKKGVKSLKVVYSQEEPIAPYEKIVDEESHKMIPGSSPFVPSVMGLIIGSEVIKDLLDFESIRENRKKESL